MVEIGGVTKRIQDPLQDGGARRRPEKRGLVRSKQILKRATLGSVLRRRLVPLGSFLSYPLLDS